jgi:hypothetical protein
MSDDYAVRVPIDTSPGVHHDSTPKGWRVRGKHPPGHQPIRVGDAGDKAAQAYRDGWELIFGKRDK